jgi:hypothetical protein
MRRQKLFCNTAFMCRIFVPDKHNWARDMTQQIRKKSNNLYTCNIARKKSPVQPHPITYGANRERGDDRYSVPPASVPQYRCLPTWRPRPPDVRNKKTAAFIKKHKVGTKSSGLFLYAASDASSSVQSLLRPAPWLFAPASGSSIPVPLVAATNGWGDTVFQTVFESPVPPCDWSIDRFHIPLKELLSVTYPRASSSGLPRAWRVAQEQAEGLSRLRLSPHTQSASGTLNFSRHRLPRLLLSLFCPLEAVESRVGGAPRAAEGFHMVSCTKVYHSIGSSSIIYA